MLRRLRLRSALITAAAGVILPAFAGASTIRDDRVDSQYTTLAAEPAFAASGYITIDVGGFPIGFGSGTLIAPNWVLTAAHVVNGVAIDQLTFGQGAERPDLTAGPYEVVEVIVHPGWTGAAGSGNDIALVRLADSIDGVTPAPLYDGSLGSEKNKNATVVGYQAETGTGLTGNTALTYSRRAMTNVVDAFGGEDTLGSSASGTLVSYGSAASTSNIMFIDFDSPDDNVGGADGDSSDLYNVMGSGSPTDLEGSQVPGDSGGGLFINVGGVDYLAGVTSFLTRYTNSPFAAEDELGYYGDVNGFTRVSQYTDFITTNIPEPGTLGLLAIAGLAMLRRQRRAA